MLGEAAADAGFEEHDGSGVPEADHPKNSLYMSIIASQLAGQRTQGVTFFVVVQDIATSARIAVCEASIPSLMGKNSFVERAAMQSTNSLSNASATVASTRAPMRGISEPSGSLSTRAAITPPEGFSSPTGRYWRAAHELRRQHLSGRRVPAQRVTPLPSLTCSFAR